MASWGSVLPASLFRRSAWCVLHSSLSLSVIVCENECQRWEDETFISGTLLIVYKILYVSIMECHCQCPSSKIQVTDIMMPQRQFGSSLKWRSWTNKHRRKGWLVIWNTRYQSSHVLIILTCSSSSYVYYYCWRIVNSSHCYKICWKKLWQI